MQHSIRKTIRELVNTASSDLFWTKSPEKGVATAAFESAVRRGQMRSLLYSFSRLAGEGAVDPQARLDHAFRDVALWTRRNGEGHDGILAGALESYAVEYGRIETQAAQQNATPTERVGIYRRVPVDADALRARLNVL